MAEFDLVIRGGTVVDGTGGEPFTADVAVSGHRIADVGPVSGRARQEIDADGAIVTPGFIDIHTHYDGQATWADTLEPSSWHGVTTAVMGNCGVGFAPARTGDRDRLISLMEGVEDIPGTALHEGMDWRWETFPDYLDALDTRARDIDVAALVPHGPLRVNVMGERGAAGEPASASETEAMGSLVAEAMAAGAHGFTTSRTLNHRTAAGASTPSYTAGAEELAGIATAMAGSSRGVIELISDFDDPDAEMDLFTTMAERSGRPVMISLNQRDTRGTWRHILAGIEEAAADGLAMRAQAAVRPIGVVLGLETSLNPFLMNPVWAEVAHRPLADRVAALTDSAFRARLIESHGPRTEVFSLERMFAMADPPDYEPPPEAAIAARARLAGRHPVEEVCDVLLDSDGSGLAWYPIYNYADGDLEATRELLTHPLSLVALADGGAHVGTICDASFPTTLLAHWARDRHRGEQIPLAAAVKAQTADNAMAFGLDDRGVVAPGYRADINVIDHDRLTARRPEPVHDLPAGGLRLLQRAEGYLATIVAGEVTYTGGAHTGALPGRLVRSGPGH